MPGFRGVTGHVVSIQYFEEDGTCIHRTWQPGAEQAHQVAGMLGEPLVEHVLTAEQMERGNDAIGEVPTVYRD